MRAQSGSKGGMGDTFRKGPDRIYSTCVSSASSLELAALAQVSLPLGLTGFELLIA